MTDQNFVKTMFALKTLLSMIKQLNLVELQRELPEINEDIVKQFLSMPNPNEFLEKFIQFQKEIA